MVGGPAGDMINVISVGMQNKIGLSAVGKCIYPYPTYAEIIRNLADAYNKTRLTSVAKNLIRGLLYMKK